MTAKWISAADIDAQARVSSMGWTSTSAEWAGAWSGADARLLGRATTGRAMPLPASAMAPPSFSAGWPSPGWRKPYQLAAPASGRASAPTVAPRPSSPRWVLPGRAGLPAPGPCWGPAAGERAAGW
jgi:hypothetical protein